MRTYLHLCYDAASWLTLAWKSCQNFWKPVHASWKITGVSLGKPRPLLPYMDIVLEVDWQRAAAAEIPRHGGAYTLGGQRQNSCATFAHIQVRTWRNKWPGRKYKRARAEMDEVASRKWSGEMYRCLVRSTALGDKHGSCAFLLFVMKKRFVEPSHLTQIIQVSR